jgi:hypothetical protein
MKFSHEEERGQEEKRGKKKGVRLQIRKKWRKIIAERWVERGIHYGGERWQRTTVTALGLESTLRFRKTRHDPGLTPFLLPFLLP